MSHAKHAKDAKVRDSPDAASLLLTLARSACSAWTIWLGIRISHAEHAEDAKVRVALKSLRETGQRVTASVLTGRPVMRCIGAYRGTMISLPRVCFCRLMSHARFASDIVN